MVKMEFGLFEVQRKGLRWDAFELGVADIDQALIAAPTVTMDNAVNRDMALNNLLQHGLSGIRGNLRVDSAIAFEDTEDDGFRPSPTISLTPHSPRPKVGFVDFDLSCEGAVERTLINQASTDSLVDRVDQSDAESTQIGCLRGWKIKGEDAQNLPKFALRNFRPFVVPVFPIRIRSLAVN
jgi:hypothetical protein